MAVAAAIVPLGCDSAVEPGSRVDSIVLDPPSMIMPAGSEATIVAEARDEDGDILADVDFAWTSSDETIVSVTATATGATITGLDVGAAQVTASAEGHSVTATVVVSDGAAPVTLVIHGDSTLVKPGLPGNGQSAYYTVTALDADGNLVAVPAGEVVWSADNASLDARELPEGTLLRAGGDPPGTARIRASWNGLSDALDIDVVAAPPPGEITLMLTTTWLIEGASTEVWLWAIDSAGNEIPDSLVTLTSDDPALLSFQWTTAGWRVTGESAGFTHARATYAGMTAGVAPVRVVYQPLRLSIAGPDTVLTGETLRYAYSHENGGGWFADSLVSWSVSDSSVLRIAQTTTAGGKTGVIIEPIGTGTADLAISATGPEGTFTTSSRITVLDGTGTTRILYVQYRVASYGSDLVWLVPELGLRRVLLHSGGSFHPMETSARDDGAYAYGYNIDDPFGSNFADVYVVDSLGLQQRIDLSPRDNEPALHPTEEILAFTMTPGGYVTTAPASIAVVPFSGGTPDSLTIGRSPTWSPDGDTIAFTRGASIYKISRHGGAETLVASAAGDIGNLDWSPDGARFIFGAAGGIYVMDADGTDIVRVADGAGPDWAPDSRRYVFIQSADGLTIGELGTSAQTPVPTRESNGDHASFPVWADGN